MGQRRKDKGEAAFSAPAPGAPRIVTPIEIQQKEFRVSRMGGYRMRDVDEFLDDLTGSVSSLVTENDRLRRQAGASPVLGSPDLDDVSRQADEIIQRARDEASRIVADARGSAAAGEVTPATSDEDRAAIQAFLHRERAFLQSLAELVQGHAEAVKGMVKEARRIVPTPAPVARAEPDTTGAHAAAEMPPPEPEPEPIPRPTAEPARAPAPDPEATQLIQPREEPIRIEDPEPATASSGDPDHTAGDPSLRELFWGEEN
jgi:DivIVA domain-containing protein